MSTFSYLRLINVCQRVPGASCILKTAPGGSDTAVVRSDISNSSKEKKKRKERLVSPENLTFWALRWKKMERENSMEVEWNVLTVRSHGNFHETKNSWRSNFMQIIYLSTLNEMEENSKQKKKHKTSEKRSILKRGEKMKERSLKRWWADVIRQHQLDVPLKCVTIHQQFWCRLLRFCIWFRSESQTTINYSIETHD